jgi:23S rRNA (adenine2030-N6)-methyltransferase
MNYRHAFHAGNFADCFKHALLLALLDLLTRKPTPCCVMDTHAGAGTYDLGAAEAQRTNEAASGILKLLDAPPDPILEPYLSQVRTQVRAQGHYPGSPRLIQAALRPQDRLVCCEKHPEEAARLRTLFRHGKQVEIHERSAWEAIAALLPPKENRGLILIDPPYEARDEFAAVTEALRTAYPRFRHGMFAAWYPIKNLAAVRGFHAGIRETGIRDIIATELLLRDPTEPDRLNGCGLLVINPPYRYPAQAEALAQAILNGLGANEPGAGAQALVLADE